MKKYIYYTKEGKFQTFHKDDIPWFEIHSPNEETPALISPYGSKFWYFEGKKHRLSGPAIISVYGNEFFYLNGVYYQFKDWIQNHPNLVIYLDAQNMNETEKAFWKLKNL